jgi:hypothetical protein
MTPSGIQFYASESRAEKAARFREWLLAIMAQSILDLAQSLATRGFSQDEIAAVKEGAREEAVQSILKALAQFRALNQPKSNGVVN